MTDEMKLFKTMVEKDLTLKFEPKVMNKLHIQYLDLAREIFKNNADLVAWAFVLGMQQGVETTMRMIENEYCRQTR